jgi:phospholipid/cholesterol/gamma-HCH transport system substrate-binding protein
MSTNTVETAIGAAVIIIAIGFFGFAYATSGAGGVAEGYSIQAEFDNVSGVHTGTDVRLAGIKIGTVVAQKLNPDNYQAQITMAIDPAIKLTEDSSAKVTSEGLLGASFIALDPGGSETFIADGGVIANTQGAVDIWTLISTAMFEGKGKDAKGDATVPETANPPANTQPQQ